MPTTPSTRPTIKRSRGSLKLIAFCRRVGVPFGINVESVSIRKVEIDASVRLAARLRAELRR
jgi:hypothetical protein